MGALRCTVCAFNYPIHLDEEMCPVCGHELNYFDNLEPMEDWQRVLRFAKGKDGPVVILQLDPPYPPWLFVSHDDLLAHGYSALEDFDVVTLNGAPYELQAYLEESNCWWVEEIVEADEVDRLRTELEKLSGQAEE
jgi:hypothetical protein